MKKLVLLALSAMVLFSCDNAGYSKNTQAPAENGKEQNGKNGTNGANGTNGVNGVQKVNGANGANGTNGSTNGTR